MAKKNKAAKGLPMRTGKRAAKIVRYYSVVAPARKLRHLLAHNGIAAARAWAEAHDVVSVFKRLTER